MISLGLTVIHIVVIDVLRNMEGVLAFLKNHPALAGTPPKEGNKIAASLEEGNKTAASSASSEEGNKTPASPEEGNKTAASLEEGNKIAASAGFLRGL